MIIIKEILDEILFQTLEQRNEYWIKKIICKKYCMAHVAIMREPFLSLLLSGEKTIESRFSKKRISPYGKIKAGDIVVLKKSGGPIVAAFEAGLVEFNYLDDNLLMEIKKKYESKICGDQTFWKEKKDCSYCTLINVINLLKLKPFTISNKNRQAWITSNSVYSSQVVIAMAGSIASGKTFISKKLSQYLGCEQYSVSDFLKSVAIEKKIEPISREALQKIGKEQIDLGWDTFVENFLEFIKWNKTDDLIIDGVRHAQFYNALKRKMRPIKTKLFYITADQNTISKRINNRGEVNINSNHAAEGNAQALEEIADFTINNNEEHEFDSIASSLFSIYQIKTE